MALFVFLFSLLSSLKMFVITNVQISGIDESAIESMHTAVLGVLEGKYLGMFSRANSFIYPRLTIKNLIKNANPQADTIEVHRDGLHAITITVHEKVPTALICAALPDFNGNELSLDDPESCYFADKSGFIFKKSPSFSGTVYHRYYLPDLANLASASSTESGIVGLYATSTAEFTTLQGFYETLKQNNIIADAILMKAGSEYEIYARNPGTSSSTAVIYFTTASSVTQQISNLLSFWRHSVDTAKSKNETPEFDYIDVRYGDNVFFQKIKQ